MKGIILAGGSGTRLYPVTKYISKQLLPIYNQPMIYYPLSTLIYSGIKDILIISTPEHTKLYKSLLGNGSDFGCNISYKIQIAPKGLAEAFIIGEEFIDDSNVALILGDNVFMFDSHKELLINSTDNLPLIFAIEVKDPERFGVVNFDSNLNVKSIEEKPFNPKSNYAIPGLYFYDNSVVKISKNLKPSSRGELEITDLNRVYLTQNKLKVKVLKDVTWFDTGTFDSLLEASLKISRLSKDKRLKLNPFEAAKKMKFINN